MSENDYWFGVLSGCFASLVLSLIALIVMFHKVNELEVTVRKQEAWIEENKEIMRTYEFFNKTWEVLYNKETEENGISGKQGEAD